MSKSKKERKKVKSHDPSDASFKSGVLDYDESQKSQVSTSTQQEDRKEFEELTCIRDPGVASFHHLPRLFREYDTAGRVKYLEVCEKLELVPVSYFVRHIEDSTMNLSHRGLGPLGIKAVCQALYSNPFIQILNLTDNWIKAEGMSYIADLMRDNYVITELNLSGNDLQSEGARILGEMLAGNPVNLRILDVSGNKFLDADSDVIASGLDGNDRLQEVNLSRNFFGVTAGKLFAEQLNGNGTLKKLNLGWNNFYGAAAVALATALRRSVTRWVDFSWNGFSDEGAALLGAALIGNNILRYLDITSNHITVNGANWLAKGLEKNEVLQTLKMGKNPINYDGSWAIINSVARNFNSSLKVLDLSDIYVGKDFAAVCRMLKEIRRLEVTYQYREKALKPIPLYSRRRQDGDRFQRGKVLAYSNGLRLETFILSLGVKEIQATDFRTFLEAKLNPVVADEVAICLSSDGIIYCQKVAKILAPLPAPEIIDKKDKKR